MKSVDKSRLPPYATSIVVAAFVIAINILGTSQYQYKLVPIKSIVRVGPSLGKMKQLRNSGHILCLKDPESRRVFCEKAFRKLNKTLSLTYNLTSARPPSEFAYRIVYADPAANDTPEVVFACACPTEPMGMFLMGWISHEKSVVEVLDYQSAKTAPLGRENFRGYMNESATVDQMRKHFLVDFLQGQNYLLRRWEAKMKKHNATLLEGNNATQTKQNNATT